VEISFDKKVSLKILRKNQFSAVGRTIRALGADGPRAFEVYLIFKVFGKVFQEKSLPGGQSAGPRWTD
jgi:hypothetical protein